MIKYLVSVLLLFFIAVSLIKQINRKKRRNALGRDGENEVTKAISNLSGRKFFILNDILLKHNEKTSQIDHIVISKKGIFVIETKNYSGTIIASKDKKYWLQVLKGNEHSFFNPLFQNEGHIRMIKNLLKHNISNDVNIYSAVVFTERSIVKNIDVLDNVMYVSDLSKYIKHKKCSRNDIISKNDMIYLKELINKNNITDKRIRNEHIRYVKKIAGKK